MRRPVSKISPSGTFQTPMPLAEKPARRWKRIAATRRSSLRSTIPRSRSSNSSVEIPSSAAASS